jgi:hypothetical protein
MVAADPPPRDGIRFLSEHQVMQRTPVIVAFFLAAALVGMMLRFTDMSGGRETFKLPSDEMAPLEQEAAPGVSGWVETSPILGSQAKPVPALPYDVADDNMITQFMNSKIGPECCPSPFSTGAGCICLTEQDRKGFASRFGNKNHM